MTTRTNTSVIVVTKTTTTDGSTRTSYYGPFLPHAGGAVTSFISRIESELEESGRYESWETFIEDVFIGGDESDCRIQATR